MTRKIIFLDIDGTLTEPGSNVPPVSAVEAIERARANGHYVVLCTGRNYDMLSPLLKYNFDGAIGSSGGYVKVGDKVIFDCPMTENQKEKAFQVIEESGLFCTVECVDGAYTDDAFKEFLKENANEGSNSELLRWREQLESSLGIRSMQEYQGQPVYKIIVMGQDMSQLDEPKKVLGDEFEIVVQDQDQYGIINGEIVNRKFDKGQAAMRVCDYLGVPVQDSIAFGDSMNDREVIEAAGYSVCMDNGSETLKQMADDICPSVTEGGLYKEFEKLGLI